MKLKIIFCLFYSLSIVAMERPITPVEPPTRPTTPIQKIKRPVTPIHPKSPDTPPIDQLEYIHPLCKSSEPLSPKNPFFGSVYEHNDCHPFFGWENDSEIAKHNIESMLKNEATIRIFHEAYFLYEIEKLKYPINMKKYKQDVKKHDDDYILYLVEMAKKNPGLADIDQRDLPIIVAVIKQLKK